MSDTLRPDLTRLDGYPEAVRDIITAFSTHHPDDPVDRIVSSYLLAEAAHDGQVRASGAAYISHPLAVAQIVADLGLDEPSVCAAICHDVVEDTGITLDEVSAILGPEVSQMVDGLTKLDRINAPSADSAKAATLRKLLVAVARDVRVLVIKLADRLHNASTFKFLKPEKARRIATETLEVYAPLAHRLGMGELKWRLEDYSFAALYPERYEELVRLVEKVAPRRDAYLEKLIKEVEAALFEADVEARVVGRAKHLWSIYEKMVSSQKDFSEIHDLVGIRVITKDVSKAYGALGVLHSSFTPVPGRFKDYIATPKFNLYQSIHTTIFGPEKRLVEVQLRTEEMNDRADNGVAAHWGYKDKKRESSPTEPDWLSRLLDTSFDADPEGFMDTIKRELSSEEVVCFTPKGDLLTLPMGATSLDFAYAVHTEVGHACVGAKVNGKLLPLDTKLTPGDTVEVLTSNSQSPAPKRDWLAFVTTPRARSRIRNYFIKQSRDEALTAGRIELLRALRAEALPVKELEDSAEHLKDILHTFHVSSMEELEISIGNGSLSAKSVAQKARMFLESKSLTTPPVDLPKTKKISTKSESLLQVEGMNGVLFRLAQCCAPVPGDKIVGYVTRGHGISVHRENCLNAEAFDSKERMVDVAWAPNPASSFTASILIEAFDRPGLLAEVTQTLTSSQVNIISSSTLTGEDQVARQRFTFTLADTIHLSEVIGNVARLDGVYSVRRVQNS